MKLRNTLYSLFVLVAFLLYSYKNPANVNIEVIAHLIHEHFDESFTSPQDAESKLTDGEVFRVTKVIDGDTFWINDVEKVRLIGVDAPETRNTRYKPKHPFGEQSKQFLVDMIMDKEVVLVYDVGKHDRYKRILAYVYLPDGTFVNEKMVKEGYATIMTVQPNTKYADLFLELQREARESGKGLWLDDAD